MTPPKPSGNERLLSALAQETADFKTMLQLLQQEQRTHGQWLEQFKKFKQETQDRLHHLEDFKLASLQRLNIFKGCLRFWPALVMTLLAAFCVGIFVDDQKVATEIAEKMELKP